MSVGASTTFMLPLWSLACARRACFRARPTRSRQDSNGYIGYTKELKKAGEPQQVSTLKVCARSAISASWAVTLVSDGLLDSGKPLARACLFQ
eukprot:139039-Pleurochrysis_carterae.AAC.1